MTKRQEEIESAARQMLETLKLVREQYAERGLELKEITRAIARAEACVRLRVAS